MFKIKYLILGFALISKTSLAQVFYKYDNKLYNAVYLNEAFRLMDSMHNYLLLDVRSPGEYADTSRATMLNIGRFKGSINISIDSISDHLTELKKYADRPIFVYCSHSQRSRRVSKLLADSGFQKIYNINGGMSVANEYDDKQFPAKNKQLVSFTQYTNIGPADAMQLIENSPQLIIIDIRTEKEFANKDSLPQNNIGFLTNAINIPQAEFEQKIDSYHIPNSKPVLLYDLKGVNSMDVVEILRTRGFTRIYNLYGGLESFICHDPLNANKPGHLITNGPPYHMLDAKACIDLMVAQKDLVILDTRQPDEFHNQSAKSYMNLGRLLGAVNVSSPKTLIPLLEHNGKSTAFLVYGSNEQTSTSICQELIKRGYQNVYYMCQGFYHFVWTTYNLEVCQSGRAFLTDHMGIY